MWNRTTLKGASFPVNPVQLPISERRLPIPPPDYLDTKIRILFKLTKSFFVTPSGLEPETPSLKVRCSKPIELRSHIVVPGGFEPPRRESKSRELPLFYRTIYGWDSRT